MINSLKKLNLAIIGLGYVGLPLAIAFQKKRKVVSPSEEVYINMKKFIDSIS